MAESQFLAQIEARIAATEQLLAGQREHIGKLDASGGDSGAERQLLTVFRQALEELRIERARRLGEPDQ